VRQLLCGVSYLHRQGVTHRDLKPENVLYSSRTADQLLISDFGLASDQALMTDTCGTPEYIAPEVLMRFAYNNKVDVWAVGVITYILLSGLMPFDDVNRSQLYRSIIRGQYRFYEEVRDDNK
jgi:protein serine kinase H